MQETSKSIGRRLADPCFREIYLVGDGIDIGAGPDGLSKQLHHFPAITSFKDWDIDDGDATHMDGVPQNTYDFVHSSHCLEHVGDACQALVNWVRITKPGGHIVVLVPDEDLYEQGVYPSTFNTDHKRTLQVGKPSSWSPVSVDLMRLLPEVAQLTGAEIIKVERLVFNNPIYSGETTERFDYTQSPFIESAIEFVLRKPRTSTAHSD